MLPFPAISVRLSFAVTIPADKTSTTIGPASALISTSCAGAVASSSTIWLICTPAAPVTFRVIAPVDRKCQSSPSVPSETAVTANGLSVPVVTNDT